MKHLHISTQDSHSILNIPKQLCCDSWCCLTGLGLGLALGLALGLPKCFSDCSHHHGSQCLNVYIPCDQHVLFLSLLSLLLSSQSHMVD